jgi:hypothetical protein
MGTCDYCGESAGLLRRQHADCVTKFDQGWSDMVRLSRDGALGELEPSVLETRLQELARTCFVPPEKLKDAIISGWESAVNHFLNDGNLSEEEEKVLINFTERFALHEAVLDLNGMFSKLVKAGTLREIMEGKVPQRTNLNGNLSFNFQKSETLVWLFTDTKYYEDRTKRRYVGGSQGFSFRIAKGVYYRIGGFAGTPVETTERIYVDTGPFAVTNKHVYFGGTKKPLRIRHDKIVSFIPYKDGIGIQRDATTAKPQVFVTGDGWFTYNLLSNISALED